MSRMPVNRIPALLALLLAAVLTAAGPAHAGDRGAQSIFTLAEPAAVVETIGDHSVADDVEVDGSDPDDSDAAGDAQTIGRAVPAGGAAPAPSAASTRPSQAAHAYSARAPPAI